MKIKLSGEQIESLVNKLTNETLVGEEKGMKFFVVHYEKDGKIYEVPIYSRRWLGDWSRLCVQRS